MWQFQMARCLEKPAGRGQLIMTGESILKKVWSETKRGHRTVPSAGEGLSIGHRFYVDQLTKDVHI